MELAFEERSLRELCESEPRARRQFGGKVFAKLKARLADLRSIDCIEQLPLGNPHHLSSLGSGLLVIDLCDGFQILVAANHKKKSFLPTGELDWGQVSRIKILGVDKYE